MLQRGLFRLDLDSSEETGEANAFGMKWPGVFIGEVLNCTGHPLQLTNDGGQSPWYVASSSIEWWSKQDNRAVLLDASAQKSRTVGALSEDVMVFCFDAESLMMWPFEDPTLVWLLDKGDSRASKPQRGNATIALMATPTPGHSVP